MKTKHAFALAIATITIGIVNADAQKSQPLQHNTTFRLELKYQGEPTYSESRFGFRENSRFVTERISNRQLLEALVEDGFIQEIRGWSIVLVTDGPYYSRFYLVKRDHDPVDLGCRLRIGTSCESIQEFAFAFDERRNPSSANSYTRMSLGELRIRIGNFRTSESQGVFSISGASSGNLRMAEAHETAYVSEAIPEEDDMSTHTITGVSLTNITSLAQQYYYYNSVGGEYQMDYYYDYETFGLLTGSMNATRGTPFAYYDR